MALTYDKVTSVISQTPVNRKDFEVNNLIPWFRKKSLLFKNLKTELIFDIIKNLQFVTRPKDDIIIRQGDQGDCMYILLRGQITIYIMYDKKAEGDDDKPIQPVISGKPTSENVRKELGTVVTSLQAGATFGEIALLKEDDCIRTASIITDDENGNDLIIVDRDLYNRSVKNVLKKEFEDKTNFIANNPFFNVWPPKYKKQLAMALIKEDYPYEGQITRQGDQVASIYFTLSGEVKIVMDPVHHRTQYPKICGAEAEVQPGILDDPKTEGEEAPAPTNDIIRAMSASRERHHADSPVTGSKFRKKAPKRQPQEVCLLGVGESIGDVEVLMDLETYMQTATCTQKTEVLILEMKHYERLLVKRNPKTIEAMKDGLDLRLQTRISRHSDKSIPLLKCLCSRAEQYVEQKQQQNEARQQFGAHDRNLRLTRSGSNKHKTMSESFDSFVPPRGALVDMYGPGTVFHRIREREKARQLKIQKSRKMFGGAAKFGRGGGGHGGGLGLGRGHTNLNGGGSSGMGGGYGAEATDPDLADPVLNQLESRMKAWLSSENQNVRTQPRIAKLHRGTSEADNARPGATVVVRPKAAEEDDPIMTGHSWAQSHIQVYQQQPTDIA